MKAFSQTQRIKRERILIFRTKLKEFTQKKNQSLKERDGKISKVQLLEINLDQLEQNNLFQNYSIDSQLVLSQDNNIEQNGNKIQLNLDHVELILIALQMRKFTAFEFYESFANFYHEQQIYKLRELGKISNYECFGLDIHQLLSSLALDMTFRELSQITRIN